MSQRPTLDPSSFGKLMEAAFVLQQEFEREARHRHLQGPCSAEYGTSAPAPDTRLKPEVVSKHETTISWIEQLGMPPVREQERSNEEHPPSVDARRLPTVKRTVSERLRLPLASLTQLSTAAKYFEISLKSFLRFGTRSWVMLLVTTGALMFSDLHYGHPHILAATTRTDDEAVITKAEQPRPSSHRRVTDQNISSIVDALSRYEIRGLQHQAEYGDDDAALTIGMAYETGRHVPQSCKEAAEWVARAARDGNAAAQYNLSLRYRTGDGVPLNDLQADNWLRKAADKKYAPAIARVH